MFGRYTPEQLQLVNHMQMFGAPPPGMTGLATLQKPAAMPVSMQRERSNELEATAAAIPNIVDPTLPDTELLKQQIGAGAGELFDTHQARISPAGGMDYGTMKPIRGGKEEIFANPKFANLLRRDPVRAAKAYQAITGRDMSSDFEEERKLSLVRKKDIADTTRGQFMRGEVRQHPTTGFFERNVTIEDPTNPMAKTRAWETLDAPQQELYAREWEGAIGSPMTTNNPIAQLKRPPAVKALVMAKYIEKVKGGMDVRTAFEQAIAEVPYSSSTASTSSAPPTSPTPDDTLAMERAGNANANIMPTDEGEFQTWSDAQAAENKRKVWGGFAGMGETLNAGAGYALRETATGGERLLQGIGNVGASATNLINQIATTVGLPRPADWQRTKSLQQTRQDIDRSFMQETDADRIYKWLKGY